MWDTFEAYIVRMDPPQEARWNGLLEQSLSQITIILTLNLNTVQYSYRYPYSCLVLFLALITTVAVIRAVRNMAPDKAPVFMAPEGHAHLTVGVHGPRAISQGAVGLSSTVPLQTHCNSMLSEPSNCVEYWSFESS